MILPRRTRHRFVIEAKILVLIVSSGVQDELVAEDFFASRAVVVIRKF
ncbi:MAG: hypothetical protein AAF086_05985 [Planctomycetota bacterium]